MVWLDGFTELHLFHGLLDSEILRGTISTTRNLWLLRLHCQKSIHWALLKMTPEACRKESAVLDWISRPFYVFSFSLRIQMILRAQLRGSGAFSNVRGRRGRLIVYHAKRIPLLKVPRMSFAQLCGTKTCLFACNLNSLQFLHYQSFDVQKLILIYVHGFS